MFTSTASIDDRIHRHIDDLGFVSLSSYKLWCRRNGFPLSLDKTDEQLSTELAHRNQPAEPGDPRAHKNHDPRRADYIRRIAAGEFDGQTLSSAMSTIRKLFADVADVDGGHDALLRLLLHVEKYGDLLHTKQAFGRLGYAHRNQIVAGLSQLARHHAHWVRPVEDWFPTHHGRRQTRQFVELAEYLLARYDVPRCLHNAWFEPDDTEREIQQGWFIHVATGNNIRAADHLPFRLTKRAAHLFGTSRTSSPPLIALRDAQVHAIGTFKHFSWALTHNEHIFGREQADFWTSVVQFVLNNPMLERNYIWPIIDYIHHQKFVPQRIPQTDGSFVDGPPAHPNFSVKGRSMNRLVREVDDWHATITGEESEKVKEWDPCGIDSLELEEQNEELKCGVRWTVEELCTSSLLYLEGRRLHHCVGSYTRRCVDGDAAIFSIRAQPIVELGPDEEEPEKTHVLTIALDPKKRQVTQARGKFNLRPDGKLSRSKARKTEKGPYLTLLRESARIMALWRSQEGIGFTQT